VTNLAENGTYTVVVRAYNPDDWEARGNYWFSLDDASYTNLQAPTVIHGAYLVNDTGIYGVTILSQAPSDAMWGNYFDRNTGTGLLIKSNGTIYLKSISASDNYDYGLLLDNSTSTKSVTVTNTRRDDFNSSFDNNGNDIGGANKEDGIFIRTKGSITLNNVDAWGNGEDGADLDNCLYSGGLCQGFGSISVLASSNPGNAFGWNENYGLQAYSHGSFKLVNTYAADNGNAGVYLQNNYSGSIGYVRVYTVGRDGWNTFERNGVQGLFARSNGTISLSKVNCRQNNNDGAYLNNSGSPNAPTISIYMGDFSDNQLAGLRASSKGSITYLYGGAWSNGEYGAYLYNAGVGGTGNVTVAGSSSNSMWLSNNGWGGSGQETGLYAQSNGNITLRYITAHENDDYGVYLYNSSSPLTKTVYVKGADLWNNGSTGLHVHSSGSISVYGINSRENSGGDGAYLNNSGGSGNVTVTTTSGWSSNDFWNNGYTGLTILSAGTVYLKNIQSSENTSGNGIYVDNTFGSGMVTVSNTGGRYWLNENGTDGLHIESKGKVYIYNQYQLQAYENGSDGIYIDNSTAPIPSYVKLYRVDAGHNSSGSGIDVHASGYIYAYSLTAGNNSSGYGARLVSDDGNVTVTGSNSFWSNGWDGLKIIGQDAISIYNVYSGHNGQAGILADTDTGKITLKYATADHNQYNGFDLDSNGDFYLYKVVGHSNGLADPVDDSLDNGLYINTGGENYISIIYSSFMTNWNGNGIEIVYSSGFWYRLCHTSYLGNGDTNLYIH